MEHRRRVSKDTDSDAAGARSAHRDAPPAPRTRSSDYLRPHSRRLLSSSSSLAASRDAVRPDAHASSPRRSHEDRLAVRGGAKHNDNNNNNNNNDDSKDDELRAETVEEYHAEVSLIARVVASLVLKWKDHTATTASTTTTAPTSSSSHARDAVSPRTAAPSTRWITHLSAWENHAGRTHTHGAPEERYTPLPVEVLEGLVDSAAVVLRGMETLDAVQRERTVRMEALEAELRAAKKENKRLRVRLASEGDGAHSGNVEAGKHTSSSTSPPPAPRSAPVDPVLAQMIAEAARATLRDHYHPHSHSGSLHRPPPEGSPHRTAGVMPVSSRPPLAGAVTVRVPTESIPPAPYAGAASTSLSPERSRADVTAANNYTPPSALRRAGLSEDGSPTILSPLTEVYSLSDPVNSHGKPSRSRSRSPKVGGSASKTAYTTDAQEAALAVAAEAQRQQDEQVRQLREAYDDERQAVAEAQRRLTALSSTVDVLRAQLALADDQRDLEVEEARLCVMAQQDLFAQEEAARWTLTLDTFAARQMHLQLLTHALAVLTEDAKRARASASAPAPASAPSAPPVRVAVPFVAAASVTGAVGKRIQFVRAPATAVPSAPTNARLPHTAVLFTTTARTNSDHDNNNNNNNNHTTGNTFTAAPHSTSAYAAVPSTSPAEREPSPASSLSSVSSSDVRVVTSSLPAPIATVSATASALPARRLPARAHVAAAATPAAAAAAVPVQTSPILRRAATQQPQQISPSNAPESQPPSSSSHKVLLPTDRVLLPDNDRTHRTVPIDRLVVSPLRELPTAEDSLLDGTPASSVSPSSRHDSLLAPPALDATRQARHTSAHTAHASTEDEPQDALGELRWQRAKQAALIDALRRQSLSRRQSLVEAEAGVAEAGPLALVSPSRDHSGGAATGTHTAVRSPSRSSARAAPLSPLWVSPKADKEGTARPLLAVLNAEAVPVSARRHDGGQTAAVASGPAADHASARTPRQGHVDTHKASTHTDAADTSLSSTGTDTGVCLAPVAAEYRRRYSPSRSPSQHAPSTETTPAASQHTSPKTRTRASAVASPVRAPVVHSASPPAERTPKSISRFYAQPTEAPEVVITADRRLSPSPHDRERHEAAVESSPPPRAPPASTLSAAMAFAATSTMTTTGQPIARAPRFELPGLGCVVEATVPASTVELSVVEVRAGSPANQAGIKKGDKAVPL